MQFLTAARWEGGEEWWEGGEEWIDVWISRCLSFRVDDNWYIIDSSEAVALIVGRQVAR